MHGVDTGEALSQLVDRYEKNGRAITVNFRKLVSWVPVGERATHYLHPYPAKLLPQIPIFFLSNSLLSKRNSVVLDPFCGSGTVLLESVLHGRTAFGADANPLARLIATVKTSNTCPHKLRSESARVLRSARRMSRGADPDVVNVAYWFYPHVVDQLGKLRRAIDGVEDPAAQDFLLVCFSACVRRVSLADPRLSVPVRLKADQYAPGHPFYDSTLARLRKLRRQDVFAEYESVVSDNLARLEGSAALRCNATGHARVVATDARKIRKQAQLASGSIDLIITSPPYVGAQKYIRASSLSLGWLGLGGPRDLRRIEDENIGREHFPQRQTEHLNLTGIVEADRQLRKVYAKNALRAHIAATYLHEMKDAVSEMVDLLRPGGHLVLVVGNNRVGGLEFHTQRYLREMLEEAGLRTRLRLVDSIRSRGLMTRRNSTASVITREWVMVMQKTKGRAP